MEKLSLEQESSIPITKDTSQNRVQSTISDEKISYSLGQGNSYVDRVIHSVQERTIKTEGVANFSLIIMLILVFVGGMASFGLWAFTHADRINTLEAERNKLISLQNQINEIKGTTTINEEITRAKFDRINKFIDDKYLTHNKL